jgi:hypothetical protein
MPQPAQRTHAVIKVSSDYHLTSDIGMLRLLHTLQISESATLDPQFLLPFGRVSGGGDAASLGSANGAGDLILTVPLKVKLNAGGDIFGFALISMCRAAAMTTTMR